VSPLRVRALRAEEPPSGDLFDLAYDVSGPRPNTVIQKMIEHLVEVIERHLTQAGQTQLPCRFLSGGAPLRVLPVVQRMLDACP